MDLIFGRFLRLRTVVCLTLIATFSEPASATVFVNENYTGAELFSHGSISFPTTAPTLSGSTLIFDNIDNPDKLFQLPLVSAGTLPAGSVATITVTMNLTRPAGGQDHDPRLILSDGSTNSGNIAIFVWADQGGGLGVVQDGTESATAYAAGGSTVVFSGSGFPALGASYDVGVVFTLDTLTNVAGTLLSSSGNQDLPYLLDRTDALTLIFGGDNIDERYEINSLSVLVENDEITAVVGTPEPSGIVPGLLAIAVLAGNSFWRIGRRRLGF